MCPWRVAVTVWPISEVTPRLTEVRLFRHND